MSERIAGVDGGAMYAGGVRSHRGGKRRSSLDAGMASRTLTIMTRWHESIRSCAGGALLQRTAAWGSFKCGEEAGARQATAAHPVDSCAPHTHTTKHYRVYVSYRIACRLVRGGVP